MELCLSFSKYCFTGRYLIKQRDKFICTLPHNDYIFASKRLRFLLRVTKEQERTRIRNSSINLRSESEHRNS